MILVDTSVWVDHLRGGDAGVSTALEQGSVLCHPWVVGELALGGLREDSDVLGLIRQLPQSWVATDDELLAFIGDHELSGLGIGFVDAQLLASAKLTPDAALWTRDRRLAAVADRLGVVRVGD